MITAKRQFYIYLISLKHICVGLSWITMNKNLYATGQNKKQYFQSSYCILTTVGIIFNWGIKRINDFSGS